MTCKDCIHNDVCEALEMNGLAKVHPKQCGYFTDKSRYVKLPCKIGDTVYIIDNRDMLDIDPSVCSVVEDEIYEMGYGRTQSGELKWLFLVYETGEDFYDDEIGKFVFLTKEEAEKALAERSKL